MKNILLALTIISYISVGAQNLKTAIVLPAEIKFDRQVVQQTNGEDGIATTTYYFTTDGSYAMMKRQEPGDDDKATILYTKDGKTCIIDEKRKTITIMNMPRVVGEGAQASKEVAEKISKKPLPKDNDKYKMTATATGKTKTICGYTSYEYEVKNEGGKSSWWYAKVDFDPILVYTMGVGKMGDVSKIKNDPAMKTNPAAIPVINKNYFWAEVELNGKKGMETKSITKTVTTFSTTGYKIQNMSKMGLKEVIKASH